MKFQKRPSTSKKVKGKWKKNKVKGEGEKIPQIQNRINSILLSGSFLVIKDKG